MNLTGRGPRVLLLCGGVGGARMAAGYAALLPPQDLLVAVNVGDDFVHFGLAISPDLDSVMYTLAGENDVLRGWGLRDETWVTHTRLAALGGPDWFQLGDRDLPTHLTRTALLASGQPLSAVTTTLCAGFGVHHAVTPVTDDLVRTCVRTAKGLLDFQDYFVRQRAEPVAQEVIYDGAGNAAMAPALLRALTQPGLEAIVIAPSNPWLSIEPLLAMPALRHALAHRTVPVIVVSPIIGGKAVKGPAAKLLAELGHETSAWGIARHYADHGGLVDAFVLDRTDAHLQQRIEALGMRVLCTDILIPAREEQSRLAHELMAFVPTLLG